MPILTGAQVEALTLLLEDTFGEPELAMAVHASTGDHMYVAYVAPNRPLRPTIRDLVVALDQTGVLDLFLVDVVRRRPFRADFAAAVQQLHPAAFSKPPETGTEVVVQKAGAAIPDQPALAAAPGFERTVRPHLEMLDVRSWRERLEALERCVCRVEIGGSAAGTGFLVGTTSVLTNWHVVEHVVRQQKTASVRCVFDVHRGEDGARSPGVAVALAAEALVASSPYSAAETTATPQEPPPTKDELDFALLRLAGPLPAPADGAARGFVPIPAAGPALAPGAPLLILQHPDGASMKLAMDTEAVIALNGNATRLRYRTNTEPGSSGSPVFSFDWELVALHHFGDPAWQSPASYNQGVPIALIRDRLVADGHADAVGS
jgi:hypothetical protein